jgi:hypothetical protein
VNIPFRTNNAIENLTKIQRKTNKNSSGVYQLHCHICPIKYIGQIGRTCHTRYIEHTQYIRNNRSNSGYSQHILNTGRSYRHIENVITITKTAKQGQYLSSVEKYRIYKITKQNLQMNDSHTDTYSPIFEALCKSPSSFIGFYSPVLDLRLLLFFGSLIYFDIW